MEKVVAFIPIKLNNQRLPGKNTMILEGKPLCRYLFETIAPLESIDEKYVYCSDESIKSYLPKEIRFLKRDSYLDGFQIKGLEIIKRFVEDIDADIYVLTHVTQPFTRASSINAAINMVRDEGYDSAYSCICIQDYCWYENKPINYNPNDIVTTQNLEPVYMETGAFFVFRREVFEKWGRRIGENPYKCVIDRFESVDIDTAEDVAFARVVARYLREIGEIN